jgi:hypothetical protein
MALQYVLVVLWVGLVALLVSAFAVGGPIASILLAFAPMLGIAWSVDLRRSWWAPEVSQVLADPRSRRRYQVRMTVALILALLLLPMIVFVLGGIVVDAP